MSSVPAEHGSNLARGENLAANAPRDPVEETDHSGGRSEAIAAATDPTTPAQTGTASEPGHDHAGARVSADPTRDADSTATEEIAGGPGISDQEFLLAVDVIYHRARAAWFAWQHRVFLFGTIMAGSAAATDIVNAKGCAFLAAGLGALDLVLDPIGRMVEHKVSVRDTMAILADLHRNAFSVEACRRARDEDFRLSANDGAPFHARRDMAHNQAVTAFGRPDEARVWVPWERRLLADLVRFEGWDDARRGRLEWLWMMFRSRRAPRNRGARHHRYAGGPERQAFRG